MNINNTLYGAVFNYLDKPISPEELAGLNLSDRTMRQLYRLLKEEKERKLSVREQAQLEGFKEAVFYLRMGSNRH